MLYFFKEHTWMLISVIIGEYIALLFLILLRRYKTMKHRYTLKDEQLKRLIEYLIRIKTEDHLVEKTLQTYFRDMNDPESKAYFQKYFETVYFQKFIEYLIEKLHNKDNDVALFKAVFDNNPDACRKALDNGANPSVTDSFIKMKYQKEYEMFKKFIFTEPSPTKDEINIVDIDIPGINHFKKR